MTEKYPGNVNRGIQTWYRLTKKEMLSLIDRGIIPLEPGKNLSDVQDGEIRAELGKENEMDEMIRGWGFKINIVNRG